MLSTAFKQAQLRAMTAIEQCTTEKSIIPKIDNSQKAEAAVVQRTEPPSIVAKICRLKMVNNTQSTEYE